MPTTKKHLTVKEALDILTDAIETNSIQYWACDYGMINIWRAKDLTITRAEFEADDEKGEKTGYILTAQVIKNGIDKILAGGIEIRDDIRKSILADNLDSECYDCIIQAALFGALVYG